PGVPLDDRLAQRGRPRGERVGVRVSRGDERLTNRGGRRVDGRADGEVDDAARVRPGPLSERDERVPGKVGKREGHARSRLRWKGCHERVILRDDAGLGRTPGGPEILEELDVRLVVVGPLVWVDIEHPRALVDAVDGALVDAGAVLHVYARLGDDIRHCWGNPFVVAALSI